MRIYLIRHGDPDYENDTITKDGHLEAQALAERMSKEGLDRIYCSPLGRAIATMKYTAEALDMDYNIEEWTQELSDMVIDEKPWGRMCSWDIPGEIARAGEKMFTHDNWHEHPTFSTKKEQEKFQKLKLCSDEFFKRHGYERDGGRYRCVTPNTEKIAVFCHGGFGLTWLAHLLEIPLPLMWTGFWLPPTSVTTILFDERSKEWAVPRCIGLGDVSHLYKTGLPVKPRGIKMNYY